MDADVIHRIGQDDKNVGMPVGCFATNGCPLCERENFLDYGETSIVLWVEGTGPLDAARGNAHAPSGGL